MEFVVGYDYRKHGYIMKEIREEILPEFDEYYNTEEEIVNSDPSHLIAMIEDNEVLGWAIWHESNTREHQKGDSRDKEDIKILEELTHGRHDLIELHELWLKKAYRGKGFGTQFFDFFEKFVLEKGYEKIIFYAYDESAINICRKRGYSELFYEELKWYTFFKALSRP
ncbi:MAG: GNAT family N-acetyltransferase [Candidatus Thorarchaeota archaeon]